MTNNKTTRSIEEAAAEYARKIPDALLFLLDFVIGPDNPDFAPLTPEEQARVEPYYRKLREINGLSSA